MFVHNYFLEQTGTIVYENTQTLVSGLINYADPITIETGTRFAVVDRRKTRDKSDETYKAIHDDLTIQFGMNEIRTLNNTGIYIKEGDTRLQYDGNEYRAVNVDNFGQFPRNYLPLGVVEVIFRRMNPNAQ